jgi:hypothetical protein
MAKALLLILALGLVMVSANSLTADSFDAALKSGKNVFVKFFAPWFAPPLSFLFVFSK